jgi:isopentenyldiphosphate isomerase
LKLFRYRKPSLRTLLGVTAAKRSVKHSLGISQVEGFIEPSRIKQKIKYRAGLYTPVARVIRQTSKGKFRTPFGL